jgi:endonuclease-3
MPVNNHNIDQVVAAIRRQMRDLPDPSVTLVGKRWKSPFLVLVSCVLSLRTKDEITLPAAKRLFKLARTPRGLLELTAARIEEAIYPVGFYRTKAVIIHRICRDLLEKHGGRVPSDMGQLLAIKGVGRKTANLVLAEGFGIPALCVDTHVHRISNRFGYVNTRTPEETERVLRKKLPEKHWADYNALLVTWGRNICRPVSPRCSGCAVHPFCARLGVTGKR